MATLDLSDLPPEARRRALASVGRKRAPRDASAFTKNRARSYAIRVLAVVADLTPVERERVLRLARDMNAV